METISYKVGSTWTEVSLTALGAGITVRLELGTHGESRFNLPLASLPPEIAPAIPFEAQCIVYTGRTGSGGSWTGGTKLFQGRRTDNSGQASGSGANQELVIEDAWYDLRFLTLQAAWANITGYSGSTPTYGTPFTWPDCVLFQFTPAGQLQSNGSFAAYSPAPSNNHITTGQSIKEILADAIYFGGVNLQIGTIDPACYVPFYPVRSMRCADAIKMALRVHPDCTCEIDYTTTPPTFNIRQRSNLTGVTLPYKSSSGNQKHLTSSVRPRPDLQPSRVGIYIKETSTINGKSVISVGTDIYPGSTPSGLRSFDASVDMTGPKLANTTANITSAAFDPTDLTWWAKKLPALKPVSLGGQIPNSGTGALALLDATINGGSGHLKGITVEDSSGATIDLTTFAYELLTGNVSSWMQLSGGGAVEWVEATITGFFSYNKTTGAGDTLNTQITDQYKEHQHHCRVKLCNTPSATFWLNQVLSTGEIYPSGLAQAIYNSLSTLQYNFTHTILESPFATVIKPGKHCLNLSGGATAWASMRAMVQGVEIELMFSPGAGITTAKTKVTCGPVEHLEPGELVQLLNIFTNRDLSKINPNERASGTDMSGGNVDLGDDTPKENSNPATPLPVETNNVYVSGGVISGQAIQSAKIVAAVLAATTPTPVGTLAGMKTQQPREMACCDNVGNFFYAIIQATEGHTKP